jgi:hypothetical protein
LASAGGSAFFSAEKEKEEAFREGLFFWRREETLFLSV